MKEIVDFFKQRYKIMIPIMVVIVLLVTVFFLYKEYKYDNYRNKQEVAVYQYFGGIKTEYMSLITYNLKDTIVDVSAKNKKIEYDSTPIYFRDKDRVLFPEDMNIVFPLNEGGQYRLYKYAEYYLDNDLHYIKNDTYVSDYNYFFLFDGKGVYFFPNEVTIKVDNKEFKKLGSMSFVKIVGGNTLEYYDKESEKSEIIELDGKRVDAINDTMEVNLTNRYLMLFGKKVLLVDPSNLNALSN